MAAKASVDRQAGERPTAGPASATFPAAAVTSPGSQPATPSHFLTPFKRKPRDHFFEHAKHAGLSRIRGTVDESRLVYRGRRTREKSTEQARLTLRDALPPVDKLVDTGPAGSVVGEPQGRVRPLHVRGSRALAGLRGLHRRTCATNRPIQYPGH